MKSIQKLVSYGLAILLVISALPVYVLATSEMIDAESDEILDFNVKCNGEQGCDYQEIQSLLKISDYGIQTAGSGTVYTINGARVSYDNSTWCPSAPSDCWNYANAIYKEIWGVAFSNSFNDNSNMLRNLSDEQLTLTESHLKEYVSSAKLGSCLRVCDSDFLHIASDGWGHSQIIVQKDSNGFTVLEGGLSNYPYCREKYYTWAEYISTNWLGYEYIKYIKWPNAAPYDDGTLTVTYNPNGGTCSESSRAVKEGAAIGTLPTPSFADMHFEGWFTEPFGGTKVTASTVPTGNMTLYAHYTYSYGSKVKLEFDANGGTLPGAVASATVTGINWPGRPSGSLLVYNVVGGSTGYNEHGTEIIVNTEGAVVGVRKYGNTSQLTVPAGGFILSGHNAGNTFVENILKLDQPYVFFNYETGEVQVFDSHAGYLAATKMCGDYTRYGDLPVPQRTGYVFNGWTVDGRDVNYYSSYGGPQLKASWTEEDYIYPDDEKIYNGHLYERYDSIVSWSKAKELCEAKGGHLVTITDSAEQSAVAAFAAEGKRGTYKIGATDEGTEGTWRWVTGEAFSYTNWDKTTPEPSNGAGENYASIVAIESSPDKQVGEWVDVADAPHTRNVAFYDLSNIGFICEYDNICEHSFLYSVEKVPTETETGILRFACSSCGEYTDSVLPVLNTRDYNYSVSEDPACEKTGIGVYQWITDGGNSFEFNAEIPATGHSYTSKVTAPNCTAKGYTTHTCTCGDSYADTYVDPLGHTWENYTVTKAPTESAAGMLTGTCKNCAETTTVALPELNKADYSYKVTKTATCKETGTARYTWNTTTYGSVWFDTTLPKTDHSYTSKVTAPTCTEKGYTTHTCSVCGDSYMDTYVDPLDHRWDDGVVTKKPTEQETGIRTYTCRACGETKTEVIPVLEHTHVYTSAVTAPTCYHKGYTTHKCICGDSYVDSYVDKVDHIWDEGTVTTPATCTKDGVKTYDCQVCDETKTETILSPGHSYDAAVTPPTCTEQGFTTHVCSVCEGSYTDTLVDPTGHDFRNGVCTRCGEKDPDFSATSGTCGTNVTWNFDTETGTLTISGVGQMEHYAYGETPWHLKGYSDQIKSVVIAKGVTRIGARAFYECTNLANVEISDSVTSVGANSFEKCISLNEITIPNSVTAIGGDAFGRCSNLICAKIGTSVVTIDSGVFSSCTKLRELHLPAGIKTIERLAFVGCNSLTDVYYAGTIAQKAQIKIGSDNGSLETATWHFKECDEHKFDQWIRTQEPGCTTTGIEQRDCSECDFYEVRVVEATGHNYIVKVTDPTCTMKGYETHTCSVCGDSYEDNYVDPTGHRFDDGEVITAVTCTKDGCIYYRCLDCRMTASKTIPATGHDYQSVVTEPSCTEKGFTTHTCSACGDSYVDTYVDSLGHNFQDGACTRCSENDPDYSETITGTCGDNLTWILDKDGTLTISGSGKMKVIVYPDREQPWAEYRDDIHCVIIEEGVTNIGSNAFYKCGALEEIRIPDTVTAIGMEAFYQCSSLSSIALPDGLTHIGRSAFGRCYSLANIGIPDSVTNIESNTFSECKALTSITLPKVMENNIGSWAFCGCIALTSINLPDGITAITGYIFSGCSSLTSITIPDSVTTIENDAFSGCSSLTSIEIPDSVTSIAQRAFSGCKSLTSISFPDGLTDLDTESLFYNCSSLQEILVPEFVESIGQDAFNNCSSLRSITIPKIVVQIDRYAFNGCSSLENIYFEGDAPTFSGTCFTNVVATAYYPENNETWTSQVMKNYSGQIIWVPYGKTADEMELEVVIPGAQNSGAVVTAPEGGWKAGTNTFTVSCEIPCAVAVSYDNGETYIRLNAAVVAEGYSFTADNMTDQTLVAVTVFGDTNGDGKITNADITKLKAVVGKRTNISALAQCAADVNNSNTVTNADITKLKAVVGKRTTLGW